MSVEIEALQRVGDGYCLRFRGDGFEGMRSQIKAMALQDRGWVPEAFNQRGGWWLSKRAFEKLGPLFRNYQQARARMEGEKEPTQAAIPPEVDRAFQVLHLRTTAPPWVVQAVYRVLAKRAHPDTGGSHEAMKAVNLAYEEAMAWAEQHQAA